MKIRLLNVLFLLGALFASSFAHGADEVILKGHFIKRPDNTYLHVEMVGVRMIFKLLDENHQEIENLFTHGIMSVEPKGGNKERIVIRPVGDGISLRGVKTIRKPHLLKVSGRLYKGEDDSAGEAFSFFYNQHRIEEVAVTPQP